MSIHTKTFQRKLRRIVRQVAGAHKSCKIEEVEGDKFPELIGKPWSASVYDVKFFTVNSKPKAYYRFRYHHSTQKVQVGIDFYKNLANASSKIAGNYKIALNDKEISLPNFNVAKFIIINCPEEKNINFKLVGNTLED